MCKVFSSIILALLYANASVNVVAYTDQPQEGDEGFAGVNCTLNPHGFYGVKETHDVGSFTVDYYYEMLIDTLIFNTDRLLDRIDLRIGETILQYVNIFESCYLETSRNLAGSFDDLTITAFSTRPHDKEVVSKKCNLHSPTPTNCFVMEGTVTFYYRQDGNHDAELDNLASAVRHVIKDAMSNDGIITDLYEGTIIKLKYLFEHEFNNLPDADDGSSTNNDEADNSAQETVEKDKEDEGSVEATKDTENNNNQGKDDGKTGLNYGATIVGICSTIVVVLLGAVMYRLARRKKSQSSDNSFTSKGRSTMV